MAMESLGPIMVAAVVANIVMRQMPGYQPPYAMPPFPAVAGPEVLLFAVMGLVLGTGAALFCACWGGRVPCSGACPGPCRCGWPWAGCWWA